MKLAIYGAGLSGIISANLFRRHETKILEAQNSLPNNHAALLRFKTEVVSAATSIPFKKVSVTKGVVYRDQFYSNAPIKLVNMYAQKVTGEVAGRSIMNLSPADRFIAPDNFIFQSSRNLSIEYSKCLTLDMIKSHNKDGENIVSTVPMPVLMDIVGWKEKPEFKFLSITTLTCNIKDPKTKCYQTLYYPSQDFPYYRVSITGNQLIVECIESDYEDYKISHRPDNPSQMMTKLLATDFGIHATSIENIEVKTQKYGKLVPTDDHLRKRFMIQMTDQYGIYSLGRFATWKQILLDDVVHDAQTIERLMTSHPYDRAKIMLEE